MEKKTSKVLNILISFGIAFLIVICIFCVLNSNFFFNNNTYTIFLSLQMILGAMISVYATLVTKRGYHLFMGIILLAFGFYTLLLFTVLPFTFAEGWPVFGLIGSVVLLISGRFNYKKMKIGYVIPSIVIFFMSVWYGLFSFDIIKLSFTIAAGIFGPLFLCLIAAALVSYFLLQQKNKKLILEEDGIDAFTEKESVYNFSGSDE